MNRRTPVGTPEPVGPALETGTRPGTLDSPSTPIPEQAAPAGAESQRTAGPRLVVARGPVTGTGFSVALPRITLGRDGECDIVINDGTVSRHHAEIRRHSDRFTITDTESLNGVYLNRQQVQHAELADGDEIWIGKARFTFHAAAP